MMCLLSSAMYQQKSVEMGWIDEKDHAYILANIVAIGTELNWDEAEVLAAVEELERFGLVEIAEKSEDIKLYLKRFCLCTIKK